MKKVMVSEGIGFRRLSQNYEVNRLLPVFADQQ